MKVLSWLWFGMLLSGCTFDPNLVGQGYQPCAIQTDCGLACTCSSEVGVCLPPVELLPKECAPGIPGSKFPGELLRFDWDVAIGAGRAHDLVVDSLRDEALDWSASGFQAAFGQALADGELTLREAVAVAEQAVGPVRIRFDQQIFGGTAGPISLIDTIVIHGFKILVDGRGVNLVLTGGRLAIEGEVIAVVGLGVHEAQAPCIQVSGSTGIFLSGISTSNCMTGIQISRSTNVWLSDGNELALESGPRPNLLAEIEDSGVAIEDSSSVVVTGTTITGPTRDESNSSGISISRVSEDIFIGPVPGLDRTGLSGNRVAYTHNGVEVVGPVAEGASDHVSVLVRGNLFEDNGVALRLFQATGSVSFVHNTVVGVGAAVIKHWNSTGPLQVEVFNSLVEAYAGAGLPARFLWCHRSHDGSVEGGHNLSLLAGHLLFSYTPAIEECENHQWVLMDAEEITIDADPLFTDGLECPFCLGSVSPAVDAGKFFETEDGLALDVNGVEEGFYCLDAPDLGAFEMCR